MTGNFFFFTAEYNSDSFYGSLGHPQHPLCHAKAKLLCIFFLCQETFDTGSFSTYLDGRPCWIFQQTESEIISLFGALCLGIAFLLT